MSRTLSSLMRIALNASHLLLGQQSGYTVTHHLRCSFRQTILADLRQAMYNMYIQILHQCTPGTLHLHNPGSNPIRNITLTRLTLIVRHSSIHITHTSLDVIAQTKGTIDLDHPIIDRTSCTRHHRNSRINASTQKDDNHSLPGHQLGRAGLLKEPPTPLLRSKRSF